MTASAVRVVDVDVDMSAEVPCDGESCRGCPNSALWVLDVRCAPVCRGKACPHHRRWLDELALRHELLCACEVPYPAQLPWIQL